MKRNCSGRGGKGSPCLTLPSHSRACGNLEGGAGHLGTPPSQMRCLAQWRFLFCSEKALRSQTHTTSHEELYFIPKSVTCTIPTPFPSSKEWSVIEGMPSVPCYVSCTLPEELLFIPIRRCKEIVGSPKDSDPSEVTMSHSIQTSQSHAQKQTRKPVRSKSLSESPNTLLFFCSQSIVYLV